MNEAETMQKAIDKLTKMRDAALPGLLEVDTNYPFSSDVVGIFAPDAKAYAIKAEASTGGGWDDDDEDEPLDGDDAPHRPTLTLLVALHSTIDAQLAIMHAGLHERELPEGAYELPAYALARAIVGKEADA